MTAIRTIQTGLLSLSLLALLSAPALATPTLKAQVDTAEKVVTVGDLFTDAGDFANKPLFLAPAPGTTGSVAAVDIRLAADRAGFTDFDDQGLEAVQVSRLSTPVDVQMLDALLGTELKKRGGLAADVFADAAFDNLPTALLAAAVTDPVQLVSLRYADDSGLFAARFTIAGHDDPVDLTGRIDLMVDAPELTATLAAGTILKDTDFAMQKVPLRLAENGNIAAPDQLVGKQLQRQSRAGMVLKISDVSDPQLVARNDLVTVYLHAGPMTLTIRGTALNSASLGQPVSVMNAASKKIIHGVARADGAVEVTAGPMTVAGL